MGREGTGDRDIDWRGQGKSGQAWEEQAEGSVTITEHAP